MSFEIKNKVALVSGGASGIGLAYVKELLKNGIKGVTVADINSGFGEKALEEIEKEFGPNKAIYVKTDVSDKLSFEDAFKKTIEVFGNIDILINNAGIFDDKNYEKEIAINFKGVLHGILLGVEDYIPKYKTGNEGVIVNTSSITSLKEFYGCPIYSAIKHGVNGLTRAFGNEAHVKRTKVRVLALCPGLTETVLVSERAGNSLGPAYDELLAIDISTLVWQKPEWVALALIKIIKEAETGTVWVSENNLQPYEYVYPPRENFAPK